ncbi:hypothetical protein WOLCODRAFT_140607 [Wolfiporia cocos MD-104 SS10]|uniref:Uncharacterized protein n=1 Tax=Wolfiporia cocos (strain MD-104) TaxID=742152 RepID=A0A2H3J5A9_WOLCO|nr:hypothetical protein WOLCODRAFT_140607 [Wolfiporia cocos MD-104 SS10]
MRPGEEQLADNRLLIPAANIGRRLISYPSIAASKGGTLTERGQSRIAQYVNDGLTCRCAFYATSSSAACPLHSLERHDCRMGCSRTVPHPRVHT